jgi:hypothetical protein
MDGDPGSLRCVRAKPNTEGWLPGGDTPVSSRKLDRNKLRGKLRHGDAAHGPHAPAVGKVWLGPHQHRSMLTLLNCAATEGDAAPLTPARPGG